MSSKDAARKSFQIFSSRHKEKAATEQEPKDIIVGTKINIEVMSLKRRTRNNVYSNFQRNADLQCDFQPAFQTAPQQQAHPNYRYSDLQLQDVEKSDQKVKRPSISSSIGQIQPFAEKYSRHGSVQHESAPFKRELQNCDLPQLSESTGKEGHETIVINANDVQKEEYYLMTAEGTHALFSRDSVQTDSQRYPNKNDVCGKSSIADYNMYGESTRKEYEEHDESSNMRVHTLRLNQQQESDLPLASQNNQLQMQIKKPVPVRMHLTRSRNRQTVCITQSHGQATTSSLQKKGQPIEISEAAFKTNSSIKIVAKDQQVVPALKMNFAGLPARRKLVSQNKKLCASRQNPQAARAYLRKMATVEDVERVNRETTATTILTVQADQLDLIAIDASSKTESNECHRMDTNETAMILEDEHQLSQENIDRTLFLESQDELQSASNLKETEPGSLHLMQQESQPQFEDNQLGVDEDQSINRIPTILENVSTYHQESQTAQVRPTKKDASVYVRGQTHQMDRLSTSSKHQPRSREKKKRNGYTVAVKVLSAPQGIQQHSQSETTNGFRRIRSQQRVPIAMQGYIKNHAHKGIVQLTDQEICQLQKQRRTSSQFADQNGVPLQHFYRHSSPSIDSSCLQQQIVVLNSLDNDLNDRNVFNDSQELGKNLAIIQEKVGSVDQPPQKVFEYNTHFVENKNSSATNNATSTSNSTVQRPLGSQQTQQCYFPYQNLKNPLIGSQAKNSQHFILQNSERPQSANALDKNQGMLVTQLLQPKSAKFSQKELISSSQDPATPANLVLQVPSKHSLAEVFLSHAKILYSPSKKDVKLETAVFLDSGHCTMENNSKESIMIPMASTLQHQDELVSGQDHPPGQSPDIDSIAKGSLSNDRIDAVKPQAADSKGAKDISSISAGSVITLSSGSPLKARENGMSRNYKQRRHKSHKRPVEEKESIVALIGYQDDSERHVEDSLLSAKIESQKGESSKRHLGIKNIDYGQISSKQRNSTSVKSKFAHHQRSNEDLSSVDYNSQQSSALKNRGSPQKSSRALSLKHALKNMTNVRSNNYIMQERDGLEVEKEREKSLISNSKQQSELINAKTAGPRPLTSVQACSRTRDDRAGNENDASQTQTEERTQEESEQVIEILKPASNKKVNLSSEAPRKEGSARDPLQSALIFNSATRIEQLFENGKDPGSGYRDLMITGYSRHTSQIDMVNTLNQITETELRAEEMLKKQLRRKEHAANSRDFLSQGRSRTRTKKSLLSKHSTLDVLEQKLANHLAEVTLSSKRVSQQPIEIDLAKFAGNKRPMSAQKWKSNKKGSQFKPAGQKLGHPYFDRRLSRATVQPEKLRLDPAQEIAQKLAQRSRSQTRDIKFVCRNSKLRLLHQQLHTTQPGRQALSSGMQAANHQQNLGASEVNNTQSSSASRLTQAQMILQETQILIQNIEEDNQYQGRGNDTVRKEATPRLQTQQAFGSQEMQLEKLITMTPTTVHIMTTPSSQKSLSVIDTQANLKKTTQNKSSLLLQTKNRSWFPAQSRQQSSSSFQNIVIETSKPNPITKRQPAYCGFMQLKRQKRQEDINELYAQSMHKQQQSSRTRSQASLRVLTAKNREV